MQYKSEQQRRAIFASMRKQGKRLGRAALVTGVAVGATVATRKFGLPRLHTALSGLPDITLKPGVKMPSVLKVMRASRVKRVSLRRVLPGADDWPGASIDATKVRHGAGAEAGREAAKLWNRMAEFRKPRFRKVLYDPKTSTAILAHELGHLRKKSVQSLGHRIERRGGWQARVLMPNIKILEEWGADRRGMQIYRKAGGRRRDYLRSSLPAQVLGGIHYYDGVPLSAGIGAVAGAGTYRALKPRKNKGTRR